MNFNPAIGSAAPAEITRLICGVDVQDGRLELEVVGWGRGEESWSVGDKVLWGDPSAPDTWAQLDAYWWAPARPLPSSARRRTEDQ